jgi:hypothetical protein
VISERRDYYRQPKNDQGNADDDRSAFGVWQHLFGEHDHVSAGIQARLITPAATSTANSAQQQPRQKAPSSRNGRDI